MDEQTLRKLRTMLAVPIDKIEEEGESLIIYIPKDKVAKAIGSNGSVVRAAELVLNKKLMIKESSG
jgi:transcription antitermination factor NusA-like protein